MAARGTSSAGLFGNDQQARFDADAWLKRKMDEGGVAFKCHDPDSGRPLRVGNRNIVLAGQPDNRKYATFEYTEGNVDFISAFLFGTLEKDLQVTINHKRFSVESFSSDEVVYRRKDMKHTARYLAIPAEDLRSAAEKKSRADRMDRDSDCFAEAFGESRQARVLVKGTFLQCVPEGVPQRQRRSRSFPASAKEEAGAEEALQWGYFVDSDRKCRLHGGRVSWEHIEDPPCQ